MVCISRSKFLWNSGCALVWKVMEVWEFWEDWEDWES